jgi:hypothetical protein
MGSASLLKAMLKVIVDFEPVDWSVRHLTPRGKQVSVAEISIVV